jgi:NADPH:quinone reductase-like Zn-dependent oxidoreductase
MRAIELTAPSLNALRSTTLPDPEPGPGEALVRLHAASFNLLDIAVANGSFLIPGFPIIPVADGAGEVADVRPCVSSAKRGDRVVPHFIPLWQSGPISPERISGLRGVTLPGLLAEYTAAPAASLIPLPKHLSHEEGATLPIAATTACNGIRSAQVRPDPSYCY